VAAPDADAQAVLEAVLRVRDWVNTPTEDMGRSSWRTSPASWPPRTARR
jgi:hypothetical protein